MQKAVKKHGDACLVSAESLLAKSEKSAWFRKQGGRLKTWRLRYMILCGSTIFYFKAPTDTFWVGKIVLDLTSRVEALPTAKKPNLFTITITTRRFCLQPENDDAAGQELAARWIEALRAVASRLQMASTAQGLSQLSPQSSFLGGGSILGSNSLARVVQAPSSGAAETSVSSTSDATPPASEHVSFASLRELGSPFRADAKPEVLDLILRRIKEPSEGVKVKTRKWRLKSFPDCFIGHEAVDWIVMRGFASTREEAVALGRALQSRGDWAHVSKKHDFKDEYLFYRFSNTQVREAMPLPRPITFDTTSVLSMSVSGSRGIRPSEMSGPMTTSARRDGPNYMTYSALEPVGSVAPLSPSHDSALDAPAIMRQEIIYHTEAGLVAPTDASIPPSFLQTPVRIDGPVPPSLLQNPYGIRLDARAPVPRSLLQSEYAAPPLLGEPPGGTKIVPPSLLRSEYAAPPPTSEPT